MPRIEKFVKAANGGVVIGGFGEHLVERKWAVLGDSGRDTALVGQQLARGLLEGRAPDLFDVDLLAHRVPEVPAGVLEKIAGLDCPRRPRGRTGVAKAL